MARSVGAARAGCCWAGRVEKKKSRLGWAGWGKEKLRKKKKDQSRPARFGRRSDSQFLNSL
jgi:hypothetical protein